jgi:tryptophan 2,3-dioxygenase
LSEAPSAVHGAEANPFVQYSRSDVLLSLQTVRTDSETEPSFLITTQVMELLFKLSYLEATRARDLLEEDDVTGALRTLRRLHRSCALLHGSWEALSALSPTEYAEFRDALGEGSGFQSYIHRHMEFVLGYKAAAMAEGHRGNAPVYQGLLRSMRQLSLYDAALRLLWRRGLPVPADSVERDWSEPYAEQGAVVDAWHLVYTDRDKYQDLYLLAEALMDVAFDLGRWRSTHLLIVERLLGSKRGTAGSSGVSWLRRVNEHRFFPELWAVRAGI